MLKDDDEADDPPALPGGLLLWALGCFPAGGGAGFWVGFCGGLSPEPPPLLVPPRTALLVEGFLLLCPFDPEPSAIMSSSSYEQAT
ncbi:MAG: hypothetical protein KDE29_21225 [Anaerolineales bacterium]|nr:hypothetical protein [Anaerolineales bacterium]